MSDPFDQDILCYLLTVSCPFLNLTVLRPSDFAQKMLHFTIKAFATQYKTFFHMIHSDENKGQLAIKLKKLLKLTK